MHQSRFRKQLELRAEGSRVTSPLMKAVTILVGACVAGVLISFAGSLYTGVQIHREESRPKPQVFPTPAMGGATSAPAQVAPVPGGMPTPAH